MSPQSALSSGKRIMYCGESSGLSNSQIAEAADVAFSQHKRLDTDCESSNFEVVNNPLGSFKTSKLQLRKRKKTSDASKIKFDTDFVSGLFRDLNEASNNEEWNCIDDAADLSRVTDDEYSRVTKKFKVSGNNLSRSCKSFTHLAYMSKDDHQLSSAPSTGRRVSVEIHQVSPNSSLASDNTLNEDHISEIVDNVLFETLAFPSLPPTVSETSCSSNNLTQTSVQAAQVLETLSPSSLEGGKHDEKDSYGWFVDMDLEEDHNRADVVTAAQQQSLIFGSNEDLSFKAFTAPKKTTELDEEVEWAKAADTVDDVLGSCIF
jgi:hypothetical protein